MLESISLLLSHNSVIFIELFIIHLHHHKPLGMGKDFFISYTGADREWAEWIAWQLESIGYTTVLQAWDFHAGGNFILEMHRAAKETDRTIAVLSSRYLEALYTQPEWAAALVQDPTGSKGLLIPVRIEDVKPDGLLASIIYVDLVGLSETIAKERLLKEIRQTSSNDSVRPKSEPSFPGSAVHSMKNEPRFPGTLPSVWNLPRRNPNFTGRDQILEDLRQSLQKARHTALTQQALYGLGGIGKTQLSIEYAYQQSASYELVWWLRAESPTSLVADYIALATELNLSEKSESEQELVVQAARKWLDKHQGWLLIFDNARDAKSIRNYLPASSGGHVLITSRNPDWRAFGTPLSLDVWSRDEAIAFLQKRTRQSDEKAADKLAEALGDLPLALEQAAAYIDTRTNTYAGYLELFNSRRKELWEREQPPDDYHATIATTWSLAFEEIKSVPMAEVMLSLCSIVAPEAIPKTLLEKALAKYEKSAVVDLFAVDDAVKALRSYSLITPDTEKVSAHRLVQAVVRDRMSKDELARYWDAMIEALSEQFPEKAYNNPSCWSECADLLPHAQVVLEEREHDLDESWRERAVLMNNIGEYHYGRAAYAEAELLFLRALEIRQKQLGSEHPDVAYSLNNLAMVFEKKGRYAETEPLYRRALAIREEQLGTEHPDVATSLNNLAGLLETKGKYVEAEPLLRRALEITEKQLGTEHPDVATSLNNLAELLQTQGKYVEVEPLYRRALQIKEDKLGTEHPSVATSLGNLASLLEANGKFAEAEPLHLRALRILEDKLGTEHPSVASCLNNLALLLHNKGRYAEAEPLYRRALRIREEKFSPEHPEVARSLNNLAFLLEARKKFPEAKQLFRRALRMMEKTLGKNHPSTVELRRHCASLRIT
jgi:tetratricopeptide (TPR) repeat protein